MVSDAVTDENEMVDWSLNPCYNGIWSRTFDKFVENNPLPPVLILVIMEYGLGQLPEW